MTQVFFYHGASDKLAAACALITGAYTKGKRMLIYAPENGLADSVDRLLWTENQLSFIPHCRADSPLAAETPVLIANDPRQVAGSAQNERLMNLGADAPPGFERFASLVEVVGRTDEDRLAARERVRRYRENGHDVRYFDLSQR